MLTVVEEFHLPMFVFCNDILMEKKQMPLNEVFEWRNHEIAALIKQLATGADMAQMETNSRLSHNNSKEISQMYDAYFQKQDTLYDHTVCKDATTLLRENFRTVSHKLGMVYYRGQDLGKALKVIRPPI